MDVLRFLAPRWIAAGLGLFLGALVATTAPAVAGTSSVDAGEQAVVNIMVRGNRNELSVRVWDRPTVQVESAEDGTSIDRRTVAFGTVRNPLVQQIPPQLFAPQAGGGNALPPEEFPFAGFRPGQHDVVRIEAPQGSHLVVTVPATTGILALRVGGGQTTIEGYRGANLFVVQNQGRVQVSNVATTAFVQMNYGAFYAADASFDRIRVRGIAAHDVFERCRSKQIEATSVSGSIVYDGGSFDPGLARFESQSGSIGLGVTGPAMLSGRSGEGHVYALFDRRGVASVDQRGEGEAVATVGGGGPLVNAISTRGNVYFYDGTLLGRRATSPEWRQLHAIFYAHRKNGTAAPPPVEPRRRQLRAAGRL